MSKFVFDQENRHQQIPNSSTMCRREDILRGFCLRLDAGLQLIMWNSRAISYATPASIKEVRRCGV